MSRLWQAREFPLMLMILAGSLAMSLLSEVFLTPENLLATLLGLSFEAIVAAGMTLLLVSGGFDLSVGSTVAMSGAVAALALKAGLPVPVSILMGLLAGATVGLANGLLIALTRVNAFIVTLGMMGIVRGILMVATEGRNISGLPPAFNAIGQSKLLGVQFPIWAALAGVLVGDLLLRKFRFFRQSYYIGGNERAALLSGIAVKRVKVVNYALTGLLAGLAGVLMTARLGAATVTAATGLELKVISAAIIGGASLQGGEGTVLGAFLGAVLMALITGALTLLGVSIYWNTLVMGSTLLLAVMIDTWSRRRVG